MEHFVYWLHYAEHTTPSNQGYVGITKDIERRRREYFTTKLHNASLKEAFANGEVKMTIIFTGSKQQCLDEESRLRPTERVGWNIAKGGMIPPDATGRKNSDETRRLKSINNVGFRGRKHTEETRRRMSESHKGQPAHNRKRTHTPIGEFESAGQAAVALGLKHDTVLYRIKSTSNSFRDYYYTQEKTND